MLYVYVTAAVGVQLLQWFNWLKLTEFVLHQNVTPFPSKLLCWLSVCCIALKVSNVWSDLKISVSDNHVHDTSELCPKSRRLMSCCISNIPPPPPPTGVCIAIFSLILYSFPEVSVYVLCYQTAVLMFHVMTGVGGYSYLYEPLWWIGMITSKHLPLLFSSVSF
jgi:hypothetical protein